MDLFTEGTFPGKNPIPQTYLFMPKHFFVLFVISAILWSCAEKSDQESTQSIEEITIDTLYTFADFDKQNIAQPTDVELLDNGLILVSDYSTNQITAMDKAGEVKFIFGREGRGPGEFQNIYDIFELNNQIIVFDNHQYKTSRFNHGGEFINDFTFPKDIFNSSLTVINDSLYAVGNSGIKDSLFEIRSIKSGYKIMFEEPRARRGRENIIPKSIRQLKAGELPDLFKNRTIIKSDGNYIYVFFEGYSEMSVYDLAGKGLWNKKIELPNNKIIFDDLVESAKNQIGTRSIPTLKYIFDFKVYDEGIYILTYGHKMPQRLVKLDSSGIIKTLYTLSLDTTVYDFDIDFEENAAYFTSWNYGIVGKAYLE
jgi:hypothetical protein